MIGRTLGPYRVHGKLGEGGMGEVFRATDTRLDREVAIKVLPAAVAADPERFARFEREAKAVAALSHPNILAIFDFGVVESAGPAGGPVVYTATELLDGESLRERLDEGPLTARKTIDYAVQIARGLAAAHEKGLVHRDIKPENIFLVRDGQVKILDFGLAKRPEVDEPGNSSPADAATRIAATDPGTVLGTVGYMAPEQVRGHAADARGDLFSFGAVLYEMLAGRRAFQADTAAETMTAILKEDPPELDGSRALSPALDRIVRHCLEKNPAERFQSARDVAFALDALSGSGSGIASGTAVTGALDVPRFTRDRRPARAIAATAAAALVVGAAAGYVARAPAAGSGAVGAVTYQPVTFDEGFVFAGRFAQDGRTIVFSADWEGQPRDVFVTSVDSPDSRALGFTGADLVALSRSGELAVLDASEIPFGNPYDRQGTLARASLTGGALRPELEDVRFADFAPDGAMAVVRPEGGRLTLQYPVGHVLDEQVGFFTPRVSPSGAYVAAFRGSPQSSFLTVAIYERGGRLLHQSREFSDWWSLAWTPDGEVWFAATEVNGAQAAVYGLDLSGRERLVFRAPGALTLHDISPTGDLLASFDQYRTRMELVVADGTSLDRSWREDARPIGLSGDGAILFNQTGDSGGPNGSVYIWPGGAPQPVRISEGTGYDLSADGRAALVRTPGGWAVVPTGVGRPSAVDLQAFATIAWAGWHRDGRLLLAGAPVGGPRSVFSVALDGGAPEALLPEGFSLSGDNVVSPDGTRILAVDPLGAPVVCLLSTRRCQPLAGIADREDVAGWGADSRSVFVYSRFPLPVGVDRLDVDTGRRTTWLTVLPREAAVSGLRTLIAAANGTLVYSYSRARTQLYVIRGLQ